MVVWRDGVRQRNTSLSFQSLRRRNGQRTSSIKFQRRVVGPATFSRGQHVSREEAVQESKCREGKKFEPTGNTRMFSWGIPGFRRLHALGPTYMQCAAHSSSLGCKPTWVSIRIPFASKGWQYRSDILSTQETDDEDSDAIRRVRRRTQIHDAHSRPGVPSATFHHSGIFKSQLT